MLSRKLVSASRDLRQDCDGNANVLVDEDQSSVRTVGDPGDVTPGRFD
jgi:hypothetical protein